MSDWEQRRWFPRAGKQPPPEHGIKIKKAGTTWWGKQWIDALREVLGGQRGRLERGATYARAGRTHDLKVKAGKVSARVTGSRPEPYIVSMQIRTLSDSVWDAAIAGMAKKAQFAAELLAGQMPIPIDEVFTSAGSSLFPRSREELETDCSCPDWGDPCKHVAATHYVLGEALDRDPFLLFELRGRSREQVLAALRQARTGGAAAAAASESEAPAHVTLAKLPAEDYDKPRTQLPALQFSFDEPEAHGAVLRQLGAPALWQNQQSPADALGPWVRAAAEHARRLALSEARPEPPPPTKKVRKKARKKKTRRR